MALREVKAQVKSGDRAGEIFTVKTDLPENTDEALEKWGEEVVFSRFNASIVIDVQALMRRNIQKDEATAGLVQEAVDKWKPDVKQAGKPPSEKIDDLMARLSPEERANIIAAYS